MQPDMMKACELAREWTQGRVLPGASDADLVARALLDVTAERNVFHALLCVVALMDEDDMILREKIYRASMPSLDSLFREGDGSALWLLTAVKRAIDDSTHSPSEDAK